MNSPTWIPKFIKTPPFVKVSDDDKVGVEIVYYGIRWFGRLWRYGRFTGRIFFKVKEHSAPKLGGTVEPLKQDNWIIYRAYDFIPVEYEVCMILPMTFMCVNITKA